MKALAALLWIAIAAPALAGQQSIRDSVNLDEPGALERLALQRPAHFAKVQKILQEAPLRRPAELPAWIQAEFAAKYVGKPYFLKTSYPAQARLSFVLDETRYVATIRIEKADPGPTPAK